MEISHDSGVTEFHEGGVRGFLHQPAGESDQGLVLTHGAGGNAKAPQLIALAETFCAAGYTVLRCDMAFRQRKPFGPPSPATGAQDRTSLREAVMAMKRIVNRGIVLGGHSYGGRQSTILASEEPGLVDALALFSYPLHPPGKPEQLRTSHFPALRNPALFVQGTKDPFGTIEELTGALRLIPARTELITVEGAGHDLKRGKFDLENVVRTLRTLAAAQPEHHA